MQEIMEKEKSKRKNQPGKVESVQLKILAVKATEGNNKKLIKPMAISSANIFAIGAKGDFDFIAKRADYLYDQLPASVKNLTLIDKFPGNWIKLGVIISFIIGLLSNYLGPSKLIHVVYNPLTILLGWNLLVYLFIILKSFLKIRLPENLSNKKFNKKVNIVEEKEKHIHTHFILDWLIGGIYKGIIQLRSRFIDDNKYVTILQKIIPKFWESYREIAGRTLILRYKSLINSNAVGLLLGALAGVYLRGMFYNYNMVWQSTFISEPETIKTILNVLFGLASLTLEGHWISDTDVAMLIQDGGTSAAMWIHIMALTTFCAIVIPRTILAIYYSKLSSKSTKSIDLEEKYYTDILKNRESLIGIIREGIREIISKKINKIGSDISTFVINDYYEKIIVPILTSFREKGGKINVLEHQLLESQEEFEPILLNYLNDVQDEFRDSVLTEINLYLGRKLDIDINTMSTYQPKSDEIDRKLPSQIASDIGDTIGGTIVTTVALAVGSVSGGIGKSLGIAIISGILGVSGPLGLLIGGVITAATLGGFYKLKREKISGMIKEIPLPAMVTSVTLTDSKIDKARKETYIHTEKEIKKMLNPKIEEVTTSILKDLTY